MIGSINCIHIQDAGVACSTICTTGSVRLLGIGSSSTQGRVEMCYNNQWGTVCDYQWDINEDMQTVGLLWLIKMHTLVKEQDLFYSLVLPAREQNHLFSLVHTATLLLVQPHVPMPMMLESCAHQTSCSQMKQLLLVQLQLQEHPSFWPLVPCCAPSAGVVCYPEHVKKSAANGPAASNGYKGPGQIKGQILIQDVQCKKHRTSLSPRGIQQTLHPSQ